MSKCIRLILFVTAVCLMASASWAVVVKPSDLVTPGSPAGWTLTTANHAMADFAPAPRSIGNGALWMYAGGDGSASIPPYPGQIFMGTNQFNGTKLSDITSLTYDTWLSNSGIWKNSTNAWYDKWSTPKQQITLRLIIEPAPGVTKRTLYFRPRGDDFADFVDSGSQNHWITNDCMASAPGYWLDFNYGVDVGKSYWSEIVARYPNGRIALPDLQVGDQWPESVPPATPNQCGLSLMWGAEMYGTGINEPYAPIHQYGNKAKNWWREACNGICFVDNVVVGVAGTEDPYIFDFEPQNAAQTVAAGGKDLRSVVSYKSCRLFKFSTFGRVIRTDVTNKEFWLDDGSPLTYTWADGSPNYSRIYCEGGFDVAIGDWYKVTGVMVPGYSNRNNAEPIPNRLHTYITLLEPGP